MIAKNAA